MEFRSTGMQTVNKMQRPKVEQQFQTRRKWSDWSECLATCLKMRHRLYCDDLITQNSTISSLNSTTTRLTSNKQQPTSDLHIKRQAQDDGAGSSGGTRDLDEERELLLKADQVEDDDYADEGDEEDQTDPCDNVEPDKTFETKPCTGGLCRASTLGQSLPLPGATTVQPNTRVSNTRLRNKDRSKNDRYDSNARPQQTQQKDQTAATDDDLRVQFNGLPKAAGKTQGPAELASKTPKAGQMADSRNGYHHINSSTTTLMATQQQQPFDSSSSSNETLLNDRDQKPSQGGGLFGASTNSIWSSTRSMWSQQFTNSSAGLAGPQANLIQWTILIGALLTIILLIMLILRKLLATTFPSYHWMLAKQTLKSGSSKKLQQRASSSSSDCCQADPYAACYAPPTTQTSALHGHRRHHQAPPGASSLLIESCGLDYHLPHKAKNEPAALGRPPHHRCYAWQAAHNRQPSLVGPALFGTGAPTAQSFTPNAGGFHKFVATNDGICHLLGSSNSKFNTDAQDVYMEPTSQVSSSSSGRRNGSHMSGDAPYNTLSSGYYDNTTTIRQQQQQPLDFKGKGFVLSGDFVPPDRSQERWLQESQRCSTSRRTKKAASRTRKSNRRSLGEALSHEDLATTRGQDYEAPVDQHERQLIGCDDADDESGRTSPSLMSDEGSPSVQSTTARMLSNAASSSFEQPPEFELGSGQALISSCDHPSSVQASPAISLPGSRLPQNNKLTCLVAAQTVQSQPNSPMFVNQFTGRVSGHKFHRATHLMSFSQSSQKTRGFGTSSGKEPPRSSEQTHSKENPSVASPQSCQVSRPEAQRRANDDCDSDDGDDRHFYEEINQLSH